MDYNTQAYISIGTIVFAVLMFYFIYGSITRRTRDPMASKKFTLALLSIVFLAVSVFDIPVLIANIKTNPLLLFGPIGWAPILMGYLVWQQIKNIRRDSHVRDGVVDQPLVTFTQTPIRLLLQKLT